MTEKVLIIADDYSVRNIVEVNLQNQGFQSLAASTDSRALQLIRELKPEIVIIDMN